MMSKIKNIFGCFLLNYFFLSLIIFFIFTFNATAQESTSAIDAAAIFKTNCATCHTVGKGVVVGPDLKDFHTRKPIEWAITWVKSSQKVIRSGDAYAVELYKKFNEVEMPDQTLNDDEIKAVYEFIKTESAKAPEVPVEAVAVAAKDDDSSFMLLTILAVVLVIVIFVLNNVATALRRLAMEKAGEEFDSKNEVERMLLGLVKNKTVIAVIVIVFLLFGMNKGIQALSNLGIQHGYAPEQPINFPHDKHAGEMQIDCKYCHSGAEKSKNAGIPSANVCMNCHKVIKKDSPEIKKLYEHVEKNIPIQWVKVHNLPDHVYFNHSQHVKVGGVECQKCHGPVQEMKVVRKDQPITMGFCVNCHRETAVKFTENNYYSEAGYEEYHEKIKNGEIKMVTVEDIGGTECQKCHY